MSRLNNKLRIVVNFFNRVRLKNKAPSIIASNCNGACICHDLGIKFNSPFVNLWLEPKDFIKLLTNLSYYMNIPLEFVEEEGISYPIGKLEDIYVYFQHYKTKDEAYEKWEERKKRIDFSNLYILFTDRDGCTYEDLRNFNDLPYKHKIVFAKSPYPEFESVFHIKGFESEKSVGICTDFINRFSGKKYYDQFNYVKWLNDQS